MEIRLHNPVDPLQLDENIVNAARDGGCFARIKWCRESQARFILTTGQMTDNQAAPEVQDKTIRALLTIYPDATIKTARAVFEGLVDFEAQLAARA